MNINADKITAFCRAHSEIREIVHEALLFDEVGSTNDIALEMASNGMPEGIAILAESQTGGKGRLDRSWFSPAGRNIYLSLLLRPAIQVREYPLFSPATAVGLVNGIREFTGLALGIKWPNDLVISDKKVGGILLVSSLSGDQTAPLVVGVGLNVNLEPSAFPEELRETATSLKAVLGREIDRTGLITALIEGVVAEIHHLQNGEVLTVMDAVRSHCVTLGKKVRVSTNRQVFEGWAETIEADGGLSIRLGDQSRRKILIGDITHLRETGSPSSAVTQSTISTKN